MAVASLRHLQVELARQDSHHPLLSTVSDSAYHLLKAVPRLKSCSS
jgi:hypothetical protein